MRSRNFHGREGPALGSAAKGIQQSNADPSRSGVNEVTPHGKNIAEILSGCVVCGIRALCESSLVLVPHTIAATLGQPIPVALQLHAPEAPIGEL